MDKNGHKKGQSGPKNGPKWSTIFTKTGPKNGPKLPKQYQKQIIKNNAKWTKKLNKNGPQMDHNFTKMVQYKIDIRADVLNPMMFMKCNVFNTKAELIHL